MNNTEHRSNPIRNEQTGTPLHKNEVVSINNELNFELLSARQQLTRILTAAKVPSVDEVVVLLERKRDSNSPQAGWVDVKDVKDFLFMMSERHEDKLCFDIADIIKFTSQPLPHD